MPEKHVSSWNVARTHVADVMARASACTGEWLQLLCQMECNVGWFQAAALDFDMLLRFARAGRRRMDFLITV